MAGHAVIFRARKTPEDLYEKTLTQAGFTVHFVKALHFEYANAEQLTLELATQHGGLILTSQTAVESMTYALSLAGGGLDILQQWNDVPVFVVGKATASAVHKLGLKSTGVVSGNAELLAEEIKKFYSSHDKSSVLPLLYPRGNLSRDTLPDALLKEGLRVNSVFCYNTTSDPEIDQHLQHLSQQKIFTKNCWVVFFSPSGVQFALPLLKMYCDVQDLKVAAIGPTTADALRHVGLVPVVAHKPSAEALVEIIR